MAATITVIESGQEPREMFIGNTAVVGRTRDNTICLQSCAQISRQHAVIRSHDADQYQIMDLGSSNGTFVNGERVVLPRTLQPNDTIRIGTVELKFETGEEPEMDDFGGMTMVAGGNSHVRTSQMVAILVCDIRGFSTKSEQISEADVAMTLGKWFREAGKVIHTSGGTIDKFIGDAVLAYWSGQPNNANDADATVCDTALEAAQSLQALAGQMEWLGSPDPFEVGAALHYGRVVCSNIGVNAERDATIIGDAVNTTFRIETVMKKVGREVVLSQDFLEMLTNGVGFEDLGEHKLKGKSEPVRVYSPQ